MRIHIELAVVMSCLCNLLVSEVPHLRDFESLEFFLGQQKVWQHNLLKQLPFSKLLVLYLLAYLLVCSKILRNACCSSYSADEVINDVGLSVRSCPIRVWDWSCPHCVLGDILFSHLVCHLVRAYFAIFSV